MTTTLSPLRPLSPLSPRGSLSHLRTRGAVVLACLPLAVLTACGSADVEPAAQAEPTPSSDATEVATATPRLVLTYDGGVRVLDATTLETVADLPVDGFARVNPAGDGRHVLVSAAGGFTVLDAGVWTEPHGDHSHSYAADPVLTDVRLEAEQPGHVVVHEGRTALFDDGTGEVTVLDSEDVADPDRDVRELSTPSAHHGVAVELSDGTVVVSEGTEDERTGVRVLDAAGAETAVSDECPGVHGEAVAADEAVVIGCENGALVVSGGTISKVASPDPYGRVGNQAGSEVSPVVLGDYKTDPDADPERPTRVSLIDTTTGSMRLVDLPSSYTFRSLGRGEDGEALVLGTDGSLHVIDPGAGTLTRSIPVVAAWEEPQEWQEARPALHVLDGTAYVTDPATRSVHAVDVVTGEVWNSVDLDVAPNEITSVAGEAPHDHDHD